MENIKPYDKYKHSNVAWLGDIPEHWEQTQLNKIFSDNKSKNVELLENNLLTLSYGKIKRKDINTANGLLPASFSNYQIVEKGDIILRMLDLQNDKTSLRIGFVNEKGIITSAYIGLKLKSNYSSEYYYELLNHLDLIKHFYNGGGGVRQSISFSEIGKERIVLPPLNEQTAIANFLEYKTTKIDRFIRKKKQLIKLLNEQKAGIINHAVTKGLDAHAKMKPSGIEWLGDIPEHWEVKRLRFLLKPGDKGIKIGPFGSAIKSDIINSKELFESLNLKSYKVYGQEHPIASDFTIGHKYINEYNYENLRNYKLSAGDIVISMMGTIGKSKVVPDTIEEGIMDSHLIRIGVNSEISSEYVSFLINDSVALLTNMKYESKGSIMSGLNSKIIKSLHIPLPKTKEQNEILDYIEKETTKLNKAISTIEKEIALVQEYRTALITEAVTGKIDVRDYKVPVLVEEDLVYEEVEDELDMVAEDGEGMEVE